MSWQDNLRNHNEYLINEVIIPNVERENPTKPFVDHTGETHNKLTAKKYLGIDKNCSYKKHHYYLFECECGNEIVARYNNVKMGKTTSCGCTAMNALYSRSATHLMTHTRIYDIYNKMLSRCYNKNDHKYPIYGGRGICVCDEWRQKDGRFNTPGFLNFYNWAIENGYDDSLSIDRIDVDKNYCPENCRWADTKMQSVNQQRTKYIFYKGWILPIAIWSEVIKVPAETLHRRAKKGWTAEQILRTPPGYSKESYAYLSWEVSPEYLKYHRPDKEKDAIK